MVINKFLLHILIFFSPFFLLAQAPDTIWTRTYGGSGDELTWGRSARQTSDGGYVIFGQTNSFGAGNSDFYIVKVDSMGDTLWTRTYGGFNYDACYSGQETMDGGFILAGTTYSFGADSGDIYLVKTNSMGDTIWTKMIGGDKLDCALGIQQTTDKGFIIASGTTSYGAGQEDIYLVRVDSIGDTIWTKTFGGTGNEQAFEVSSTFDGGYIIAAWTQSFGAGNYDAYIIKTDSVGDTIWTFTYGGTSMDKACEVIETSDGYFLVVGWTYSFGSGYNDMYIMKMTPLGDSLFAKLYGGPYYDGAYSVQETMDSNYIVAGGLSSSALNCDLCLWKLNTNGDSLWTITSGGAAIDYGFSVAQTTDQGYMVAGYTNSYGAGGYDFYLVKIEPEQHRIEEEKIFKIKSPIYQSTIFKGPVILPKNKSCKVFDIAGRIVNPNHIKPGIYFIRIDNEIIYKVIKVK